MSYNQRSVTTSIRIDRGALRVLEWKAHLDNVPLRTSIRAQLEGRAEEIVAEYDLHLPPEDDNPTYQREDVRGKPPASAEPIDQIQAAVAEVLADDESS